VGDWLCPALMVLALVILGITIVGHFLWLFFAWLLRTIFGRDQDARGASLKSCPRCGALLSVTAGSCFRCGWGKPIEIPARGENDLKAAARQMERFRQSGAIALATYERVVKAINDEEQQRILPAVPPQPIFAQAPADEPVTLAQAPAAPHATPAQPLESSKSPQGDSLAELYPALKEAIANKRLAISESPSPPRETSVPAAGYEIAPAVSLPAPGSAPGARPRPLAIGQPYVPPAPPPPPRKPFSEMLGAFMEEKNIRWGELVGGFLIIGCSIALVFSLWTRIEQIAILKFFLFTGVTSAIFGVGLYTEHRWKLPTTSRGVLIIATLLVPLNFLAISAFSKDLPRADLQVLVAEAVALVAFSFLTQQAGRVIVPGWSWILTVGVLGSSLALLVLRRFAGPNSELGSLFLLGSMPLLCYGACTGWMLHRTREWTTVDEREANRLFILFGAITFAALAAFGLLVYNTGRPGPVLRELAPLVSLGGVPALASGLVLWRRLADKKLGSLRTAGTSIAVFGAGVLLVGIVLAWPRPSGMLPVALLDFVALTVVAIKFDLPAAHLLAAPCLVLAYLVGFHLLLPKQHLGHVTWNESSLKTVQALISASSGTALAGMCLLLGAISEVLRRFKGEMDSWFYRIVTAAVAVASLGLVTWFGFGRVGDPHHAAAVYALFAVAAFEGARQTRHRAAIWAGSTLALVALVQAIVFKFASQPDVTHWQLAMLVHSTAAIVVAMILRRLSAVERVAGVESSSPQLPEQPSGVLLGARRLDPSHPQKQSATISVFANALSLSGLASSGIAVPLWLFAALRETATVLSAYTFWLAAIWFAVSYLHRLSGLFTAGQFMLTLGVVFSVTAVLKQQDWFAAAQHPLLDPWTVQAQGIALAVLSLAWVGARVAFRHAFFGVRRLDAALESGDLSPLLTGGPVAPDEKRRQVAALQSGWRSTISWLLYPPWPPLDRMVTVLVLFGLVALAAYGVAPGIVQELAPRAAADAPAWSIAGIPHLHAQGPGSWILLALLLVVLVASLWERFEIWLLQGAVLAMAAACAFLAGGWDAEVATASAMRWLSATFLILGSLPIWFRNSVWQLAVPLGWPDMERRASGLSKETRSLLLVLTLVPVLALTLYPAAATLADRPVVGAGRDSFFGQIGNAASFVVPLAVVCLALVGHAVRERSAGFAFSAGLVLNLTVTLGYLLFLVTANRVMGDDEWVRLIQFNAIAAAGFAIAWLNLRGWLLRTFTGVEPDQAGLLLKLQVAIGLGLNLLLLIPADLELVFNPRSPGVMVTESGSQWAWLAMILAVGSAVWLGRTRGQQLQAGVLCACLVAFGSVISFSLCRWDLLSGAQAYPWLGYHTLLVCRAASAWFVLALGWISLRAARHSDLPLEGSTAELDADTFGQQLLRSVRQMAVQWWSGVLTILTVILALRAVVDRTEPGRPWWTAGALVSTSLFMAALARYSMRRGYLYWAGILFNLAASIWWVIEWSQPRFESLLEFFDVNVIALALPGIAWLMMELQVFRGEKGDRSNLCEAPSGPSRKIGPIPFFGPHHVAAIGSLLGVASAVGLGLFTDAIGRPMPPSFLLDWTALTAAAAIMLACLWDSKAKYAVAGVYVLGLLAVGRAVDHSNLGQDWLTWSGTILLAAYSIATSYLWSQRDRLTTLADSLRIPRKSDSLLSGQLWLITANQLLATAVVVLAYFIVLTFDEYSLRLSAAKAAIVQSLAVGLLAQGTRRPQLQRASLALVVIGAVAWGWAWLEPGAPGNILNRAVIVVTVLAAITALYGLGLGKFFPRETEWTRAAKAWVPSLIVMTAMALVFVLGTEVVQFLDQQKVDMGQPAIAAIIAALGGLCLAALVAAVVPGRDPLSLSERGRMFYVYAAEAFAGLLFMHIRLTMPWLFHGWFMRYWTLIVVVLAFLGVGLSELFRRQNRLVLAEPLERTGAFLPILSVLSFWILRSHVNYSVLLLLVGVIYGTLSVARKSFGFGLLAALAANVGFGYHLHELGGYELLRQHPQLWLIPAALSVLAAAYLNRDQLKPDQFVAIRYITIMIIYVSSTADIFINGVKDAPWLPMVLAGLSVAGIFAGMLLRVRAFLFLGSAFLVLSLVTMIHSASVNLEWTWLWSVAGISLGMAIIAVFAVFEKKRNEVLQVVDGLKQWER